MLTLQTVNENTDFAVKINLKNRGGVTWAMSNQSRNYVSLSLQPFLLGACTSDAQLLSSQQQTSEPNAARSASADTEKTGTSEAAIPETSSGSGLSDPSDLSTKLSAASTDFGPRMLGVITVTLNTKTEGKPDEYLAAALSDHLVTFNHMRSFYEASNGAPSSSMCQMHAVLHRSELLLDEYLQSWARDANPFQSAGKFVLADWQEFKSAMELASGVCYQWKSPECWADTGGLLATLYPQVDQLLERDGYQKNLKSLKTAIRVLIKARKTLTELDGYQLGCDPSGKFPLDLGMGMNCEKQPITIFDVGVDTNAGDFRASTFLEAYKIDIRSGALSTASAYCQLTMFPSQ